MTTPIRPLTTLIAALALVLTMLGHGFARAQPPASALQSVVICAHGEGEAVIELDTRGVPVPPGRPCVKLCPECLALSAFALPPTPPAHLRVAGASARPMPPHCDFIASSDGRLARVRGPPSEI